LFVYAYHITATSSTFVLSFWYFRNNKALNLIQQQRLNAAHSPDGSTVEVNGLIEIFSIFLLYASGFVQNNRNDEGYFLYRKIRITIYKVLGYVSPGYNTFTQV